MSKILDRIEMAAERMMSEEWQEMFFSRMFKAVAVLCLVGALWNWGLLIFAAIGGAMYLVTKK